MVSLQAQASGGKAPPRRPGDTRLEEDPTQVGFGSGFIISPKGVIVTNNHVVEGADQVLVQMASGKKFTAKKILTDLKTDMAIIQLDAQGVAAPIWNSATATPWRSATGSWRSGAVRPGRHRHARHHQPPRAATACT